MLLLLPVALHFAWQVFTLQPGDSRNTLARFQSNRVAGALLALAILAAHLLDAAALTP